MTDVQLPVLVEFAIRAALQAGREIMAVYAGSFGVEHKEDDSPLTEADLRAHRAIVAALQPSGLPVLSEEGALLPAEERRAWSRYWLVDPLDGTKEFVRRNGEFTVNIALMEAVEADAGELGNALPIAGVLYVPVKDLLYFAWKGGGAHVQEQAATTEGLSTYERSQHARRLPLNTMRDTFTIVASRSHRSPETEAFIQRMEQQHSRVELTSMGSALKICLVAEGKADVYPRYAPTMEWDTAAGHAICMEAGREITDLKTGAAMRYNKHDLMNNWFIVQ
jgi:3'(2'), 5'-bisphosphate nucleotidase